MDENNLNTNYCPKQRFFVFHNCKAFQGGKHGCKGKKNLQVRKTFIFVHALQTQCSQEIFQLLKRHELPVCHMCVLTRAVKYPSAFHLRAEKIQRFQDGFEAMFLHRRYPQKLAPRTKTPDQEPVLTQPRALTCRSETTGLWSQTLERRALP